MHVDAIPKKVRQRAELANESLTNLLAKARTLVTAGATAPKGEPAKLAGLIRDAMKDSVATCKLVDDLLK